MSNHADDCSGDAPATGVRSKIVILGNFKINDLFNGVACRRVLVDGRVDWVVSVAILRINHELLRRVAIYLIEIRQRTLLPGTVFQPSQQVRLILEVIYLL